MKYFVQFIKPVTVGYYVPLDYKIGDRKRVFLRELNDKGYMMPCGHGVSELIRWDCIKLVEVRAQRRVTDEVTERLLPTPF